MNDQTINNHKASARREHFARGGTPGMWRGLSKVFKDKRKEDNKDKCRNNNWSQSE